MLDLKSDWFAGLSDSLSRKWNLSISLAVQSFHHCDCLMSRFQSEFYGEYSSDDILSQEHLTVVSVPCDVHKEYVKDTFFSK